MLSQNFVFVVGMWVTGLSLQKEPRAALWFFLFQIKESNLQINKNGHFEKKWSFREPVAKFDGFPKHFKHFLKPFIGR